MRKENINIRNYLINISFLPLFFSDKYIFVGKTQVKLIQYFLFSFVLFLIL